MDINVSLELLCTPQFVLLENFSIWNKPALVFPKVAHSWSAYCPQLET